MFNNPKDFWVILVFALITLIIIGAIYFVFFLKILEEKRPIETVNSPKLVQSVEPVAPSIVATETSEIKALEAQKENRLNLKEESVLKENNDFYVQIAVPVLRVRSGPNVKSPIIRRFSKGMIVKVKEARENEDELWYKIQQPPHLRYPERITSAWFIAGKYNGKWLTKRVEKKEITVFPETKPKDKWIKVNLSKQTLQAFERDKIVFETLVSTGRMIKDYQTPTGTFRIFRKELSVYMQGPLPDDDDRFDLPGIPYVMYFDSRGDTIHGTYWHSNFGRPASHGCINLSIEDAQWVYWWANQGTKVVIENGKTQK